MEEQLKTDVCIVGAGPAGAMLGLLCARSGLRVTVLEKKGQFSREFRGEGITPGGVSCLREHGVLDRLQPSEYVVTQGMRLIEDGRKIFEANFDILRVRDKLALDLPQPTLLRAIVEESKPYPEYEIRMGEYPTEVVRNERGQVTGVVLSDRKTVLHSKIVVACDGRYSQMRKLANFAFTKVDIERDVVWFRLKKPAGWDDGFTQIRIIGGSHLIVLPCYPDLLRVGLYMPKGGFAAYKKLGIENFHAEVERLEPAFAEVVRECVTSFRDVTLLDIFLANAHEWAQDGIVLIGDSAHTCSPILGQGVNLALRDAVDLSRVLAKLLGDPSVEIVKKSDLDKFVAVRKKDIAFIQSFQKRAESLLGFRTPFAALMRRIFYRWLNISPAKPFLFTRICMGTRSA